MKFTARTALFLNHCLAGIHGLIVFCYSVAYVGAGVPNPSDVLDLEAIRPAGEFRESLAPDTLDLAQHAAWSVNALTGNVNPD